MRSKALVLGATPPFVGPWVPLQRDVAWSYRVDCQPIGASLNGQLTLNIREGYDVADGSIKGKVTPHPLGEVIRGVAIQAVIGEVEGVNLVSVYLEEIEE